MKTANFPVTVIDDFFDDPDSVREFALAQEYETDQEGNWPGKRTKPIHELNPAFFNLFVNKIVSVFYDFSSVEIKWTAAAHFQLIDKSYQEGWVHLDKSLASAVIYLSKDARGSGTTIYRPIDTLSCGIKNNNEKVDLFKHCSLGDDLGFLREENNQQFRPTVSVESEYNRLVLFDGHMYHAANNFFGDEKEDSRLTLICFLKNISFSSYQGLPVSRLKTLRSS